MTHACLPSELNNQYLFREDIAMPCALEHDAGLRFRAWQNTHTHTHTPTHTYTHTRAHTPHADLCAAHTHAHTKGRCGLPHQHVPAGADEVDEGEQAVERVTDYVNRHDSPLAPASREGGCDAAPAALCGDEENRDVVEGENSDEGDEETSGYAVFTVLHQ